jgi:hypothetical protein
LEELEYATYSAKPVILLIITRLLDVVSADYSRFAVVIITSVGRKIDLPKELLLMMLELSDHCVWVLVCFTSLRSWRGRFNSKTILAESPGAGKRFSAHRKL